MPGEIVVSTGLAADGLACGQHATAGQQLPAGRARQLVLEDELESVEADLRVAG